MVKKINEEISESQSQFERFNKLAYQMRECYIEMEKLIQSNDDILRLINYDYNDTELAEEQYRTYNNTFKYSFDEIQLVDWLDCLNIAYIEYFADIYNKGDNSGSDSEIISYIKSLSNDDYQNRDGDYPKSNIPDEIYVRDDKSNITIYADFKDTSKNTCLNWIKKFIRLKGLDKYNVEYGVFTGDDNEYEDDWNTSYASIDKSNL